MGWINSILKKGSQGEDVSKWQEFLNNKGYKIDVDGIFDVITENATKAYQTAKGLVADGIAGIKTTAAAIKENYNNTSSNKNTSATTSNPGSAPTAPTFNTTVTATPEAKPLPNAPTYDSTSWDDTEKGQAALEDYNTAKYAVNSYGDFTYEDYMESDAVKGAKDALDTHNANKPGAYQSQWQAQLDALMNSIMNRDKFSYDLNGDALYQQYKDKYVQQGKMAMADTMGQAAAMTGGYGNSYAQSVGQQAYQAQLDNLNDIVPELYQMALDRYNMEGQELYNQYGMVMDRENTDYGRYRDKVSDWMNDRSYLQGVYNDERGFDYGKYVDDRNLGYTLHQDGYKKLLDSLGIAQTDYYSGGDVYRAEQSNKNSIAGQQFNDAMSLWGAETDQAWKEYQASEDARQYANTLLQQGYQNEFGEWEANTNNYWREKEFDESVRRYDEQNATSSTSDSGNSSSGNNGNKGTTPSGVAYDNGSVSDANIIKMQEAIGVGADGYWGPKSTEAAGGLSADEAWAAYQAGKLGKSSVQPTESKNTTDFINRFMTKSEYLARNHSEKEWNAYMEDNIASFLRSDRINDSEALYLLQYYGIS